MKLSATLLVSVCLLTALAGCGPKTNQGAAPPQATEPATGLAGTLRVGVPCGLAMAYKEVRTLFLARNPGVKIIDHVGNIGPMTREVRDAKVKLDLFLSLGELEIKTLTKSDRVQGTPTPYLRQDMQLLVQKGNPLGIKRLEDLAGPKVETIALCVPELTLGHAADEALRSVGLLDRLEAAGTIIRIDQPMQAKELVFKGKADATFIYAACSTEEFKANDPEHAVGGKAHVVMTVPEAVHGGMFAVAAVLKTAESPELARQFIDFMLSAEAQDALAKAGYGRMNESPATAPGKS